jgi:uncharacterized protein (TIGR02466 family)
MQITDIFTSFVAYEQLNLDLEKLKKYCYKLKDLSPGRVLSNFGGWQSNDLPFDNEETKEFRQAVATNIAEMLKKIGLADKFTITNYWLNVNGTGDFNRPHYHGFSTISGIFYIETPLDCGKLVLRNPSNAHGFCIDAKFVTEWNPFNSFTWEIEPEPNKLLMWPAWIDHYTLPNNSKEDRISIAFNVSVFDRD